ncbi:MAG TPA: tRNA (adenosine(37)-N6)-threonylcarbamoyltransferase complex dimerization subunit type 1 TsaB [Terriglobales bacterium]|nr:tRNA (adenosine(37)-N6)-threonylcarbamoyltransferase complex dimerization subunit type 1 TsaB [Terriglobales bacterium]
MRILAVDTATSTASVALIEDGTLVAQHPSDRQGPPAGSSRKGNHSEIILPLIESSLREAQFDICDISLFAISIGPGSFTGLRIGLSTLKGLAYGGGAPVVGVSTLLANAARVTNYNGLICSILNARKSEVYTAVFRKDGDRLFRMTEDSAGSAAAMGKMMAALDGVNPCLFVGDGAIVYRDLIREFFGSRAKLSAGNEYPSVAFAVARLSMGRSAEGSAIGELVPKYLRAPECEMKVGSVMQLVEMPSIMSR